MGVVSLAMSTRGGRVVEFKALPSNFVAASARPPFVPEAQTLASLTHRDAGGTHGVEKPDCRGTVEIVTVWPSLLAHHRAGGDHQMIDTARASLQNPLCVEASDAILGRTAQGSGSRSQ